MSLSNWDINIGDSFSLKDIELSSSQKEESSPQLVDTEREVRELANSLTWYSEEFKTRKEEALFWEEMIEHYKIEVSTDLLQVFAHVKQYG